jgi:hypothetical protein
LPLEAIQLGDVAGLVYLGVHKGAPGRYYFTRSLDQGATWQPGVPVTPPTKLDDVSRDVQLASASGQLVFSYVEVAEDGPRRQRFMRSTVEGTEWTEVHMDEASLRGFVQLQGGPSLVLAGMRKLSENDTRAEIFVCELVPE